MTAHRGKAAKDATEGNDHSDYKTHAIRSRPNDLANR
jgi:hypothetical protein